MTRFSTLKVGLIFLLFVMTACSHIDEGDRLIYVKPEPARRTVLLEDFTGQRCVNCPTATAVAEQLVKMYGDTVIVVAIHGGPLGFKGNASAKGLATDLGDTYYSHWGLEYQPVGLIDRLGAVNYTDWTAHVTEELHKTSPLSISLYAKLEGDAIDVNVTMMGREANQTGKLQVWLTEDGITALQMMPDGTAKHDYVHHHVLRAAVNGNWGEDFSIGEGETKTFSMQQAVDAYWNTAQLFIVAFAYSDNGVMQAARVKVQSDVQQ